MTEFQKMVIDLPQGGTVEVEYTDLFMEQVRHRFGLDPAAEVTPDMVRRFIIDEVGSALEKEEG